MQIDLSSPPAPPTGLAFAIPDLLLAKAFAESCSLRLVVETDHRTEAEELEEVLALYDQRDACSHLIWRSAAMVVVQPIPGRARRFACLADALEWVRPESMVTVEDIVMPRCMP